MSSLQFLKRSKSATANVALAIVCVTVWCTAAAALEPADTMAAWKTASPSERLRIVTDIAKKHHQEDAVKSTLSCVDLAAGVPGHVDLPIGQVVMACLASGTGDPV